MPVNIKANDDVINYNIPAVETEYTQKVDYNKIPDYKILEKENFSGKELKVKPHPINHAFFSNVFIKIHVDTLTLLAVSNQK